MAKKLISMLVVLCMIGTLFVPFASAQEAKEPVLTMGMMSDLHIGNTLGTNKDNYLNSAIDTFESYGADGIGFVGDMIYHKTPDDSAEYEAKFNAGYDAFLSLLKDQGLATEAGLNENVVYGMGNHEYPENGKTADWGARSRALFTEKTGKIPTDDTVINGYHFITGSPDGYYPANYDYADEAINGNQNNEDFVAEKVAAAIAAEPNKPVFVILHHSPKDTYYGLESEYDPYGSYRGEYSDEFLNYILNQPQVVIFTAHTHYNEMDPKTIYQIDGGATMVQTGVTGGSDGMGLVLDGVRVGKSMPEVSQGVVLEVDADNVVSLKRVNFLTGEEIGTETWTLDIPAMVSKADGSYKYTAARYTVDEGRAVPTLSGELNVSEAGISADGKASLSLSWQKADITPNREDEFVEYYRLKLKNMNTYTEETYVYMADFYAAEQQETFTTSLGNLALDTEYQAELCAVSSLLVDSAPLTATFITPAQTADEPDYVIDVTKYSARVEDSTNNALLGVKTLYDSTTGAVQKYLLFNNSSYNSAWIEYTIPASLEEGYYDVDAYYWTTTGKNGLLRVYQDGKLLNINTLTATTDKDYYSAVKTNVAKIYHDGENDTVLRLERDSSSYDGTYLYSYYYIRQVNLTKTEEVSYSQAHTDRSTLYNGGDLRDRGHGYFVVDTVSYIEHTVTAEKSGYYDMTLFYANEGSTQGVARVMVNGAWAIRAEMPLLANSQGQGFYAPASLGTIYLNEGENVIRIMNGRTFGEDGVSTKTNYFAYCGFNLKESDKKVMAIAGDTGVAEGDARINSTSLRINAYGSAYAGETRHDPIMGNSTAFMTYEIDVPAGYWDVTILYGTGDGGDAKATLAVNDGAAITTTLPMQPKSWLSRFTPASLGTVALKEGKNKLVLGVAENKYYTFTGLILTRTALVDNVKLNAFDDIARFYCASPNDGTGNYSGGSGLQLWNKPEWGMVGVNCVALTDWVEYDVEVQAGDYLLIAKHGQQPESVAVTVNGKLSLVTDMPGTGRDANNDIKHMVDAGNVNNELGIITLKDGMNTIRIGRRSGGTEGAMPFTHLTLTKVSERPVIEAAEVKLYDDDWKEVTTITNDVDVTAFAKVPDSFSGKEVTMVFAVYKGNRLYRTGVKNELALKDTKLSIRLTGLEECEEGYSVKVMFLESLGSLAPLS